MPLQDKFNKILHGIRYTTQVENIAQQNTI